MENIPELDTMTTLIDKLNWRYATKKMDPARAVPDDRLERILEAVRLAPTSAGLQPFEVIVVTNPEVKARIRAVAHDQAQVTDGSHLLVFAAWENYTEARLADWTALNARTRGGLTETLVAYAERLRGVLLPRPAEQNHQHAARQAYIALGLALTAAAFEEVDATPMEGFDPPQLDAILGLDQRGLKSVVILALGYRAPDGDWLNGLPKVRRDRADLVREVA
jgi:nitroreductase/dihydropteridine reductase